MTDFVANITAGGMAAMLSGGNDLITDNPTAANGGFTGGVVAAKDPKLAALAGNGGPTQTMALQAGSPAIDAGNNSFVTQGETDQRGPGFARVVNGTVDIGAFEAPPAVQFAVANQMVAENSTIPLTVTVTLSAASSLDTTVPITFGGTAKQGIDYAASATSVLISAGQTSATFTITPINDRKFKGSNKTLVLGLGTLTNARAGMTNSDTVTITDSDPPPMVSFVLASQNVNEADGAFFVQVQLSAASAVDTTIPIDLSGTAQFDVDYSNLTGPGVTYDRQTDRAVMVIRAGAVRGEISGTLMSDPGPSQTLTFTLATPTNATVGSPGADTLIIAEPSPGAATISSLDPTSGFVNSPFTVVISGKNFVPGSTVVFGGDSLAPDAVTPMQVTFTVPADVSYALGQGVVTVVVVAPLQAPSNVALFTLGVAPPPNRTLMSRDETNRAIVDETYRDLFNRNADLAGLTVWANRLDGGESLLNVVLDIEHDKGGEFLQVEVKNAYLQFLHRQLDVTYQPDQAGLQADVNFLAQGHSIEELDALIVSGVEYQTKAATRGGFVKAFYEDALARDPGGPQDPAPSSTLTAAQIKGVFGSPEFHTHLAEIFYMRLLHRAFGPTDPPPDSRFQMSTSDGQQMALIIGDPRHEWDQIRNIPS